MGRTFTREELYNLVWSQPMRTLAATVGVSDVALAKACRKANIPVPERGYWARKQAGKRTVQRRLPPRFPGASDEVVVGDIDRFYGGWQADLLKNPLPPPPTFEESMEAVTERVRQMVGKVTCPKSLDNPHKLIAVLLERDEKRRAEYARTGYSWDQPEYDSPIERRRLRILNAIFKAAERLGCKPWMRTAQYAQDKYDASITVGSHGVSFTLAPIGSTRRGRVVNDRTKPRLGMHIGARNSNSPPYRSWEDTDEAPLEALVTTLVVELIVAGEAFHRESAIRHHKFLIERKAELEEEERQRMAEAELKARELLEKQAQERIDNLLGQAAALHQAETIRRYVQAVRDRAAEMPTDAVDLDRWSAWALAEADSIDPVKNGTVMEAISGLANSAESTLAAPKIAHVDAIS